MSQIAAVLGSLEAGAGCVIFDALDEAELRAGPKNFSAFPSHLARSHRSPRPRPSLVLLARTKTADDVALHLVESGVAVRVDGVQWFAEQGAKDLIDLYLDAEGKGHHRTHRVAFEALRDALFERVAMALGDRHIDWSSDNTRRFLGYAPVLAAHGEYLNVPNPQQALNELRRRKLPEKLWPFMVNLVGTMLTRERGKALAQLRSQLQTLADRLAWSRWEDQYGQDEQCSRVLAVVHDRREVELPTLEQVPAGLRAAYEEALAPWMANHPFVGERRGFRNIVFQDYAHAYALAGGRADLCGVVRDVLSRQKQPPSPLLGPFLLTIAPKKGGRSVIAAEDIGGLYDSLQSFSRRSDVVALDLAVTAAAGIGRGVARFPAVSGRKDGAQEFEFEFLTGDSSPVRFGQQLSNAVIDLDTPVELGYPGRPMTIGPDVVIDCKVLRMTASSYRVDATVSKERPDAAVALIGERMDQVGIPEVEVVPKDAPNFSVQVRDTVHYPWAPYRTIPQADEVPQEGRRLYSRLRRLLLHFRAHGREELARYADFVDNVLLGRSAEGSSLLKLLLGEELLQKRGDMYFLSRERLEHFGIPYRDLVAGRVTPQMAELLAKVS